MAGTKWTFRSWLALGRNVETMEQYLLINEEYGFEAIVKQRLRDSLLGNLNDPFELFAVDLYSSREFSDALITYKSYLALKHFLLCFRKTWRSPILWSHYADRQKECL